MRRRDYCAAGLSRPSARVRSNGAGQGPAGSRRRDSTLDEVVLSHIIGPIRATPELVVDGARAYGSFPGHTGRSPRVRGESSGGGVDSTFLVAAE